MPPAILPSLQWPYMLRVRYFFYVLPFPSPRYSASPVPVFMSNIEPDFLHTAPILRERSPFSRSNEIGIPYLSLISSPAFFPFLSTHIFSHLFFMCTRLLLSFTLSL
mmetsp:Transcript_16838/g.42262  ORF Transcript_16838/g.42262 Transcript_16838/m.42262 type:complete len:107 (-) Transcript_16838:259-579(-)